MNNPKMKKWEKNLRRIFDEIDDHLEDTYGEMYPLHPARAPRGHTANKSHDGLFNVGAAFSAGYGSKFGRGWVVDIRMVTLSEIEGEVKEKIHSEVAEKVRDRLKETYPEQEIRVEQDGNIFKIFGDIDLKHGGRN
jgi:hypothetical protein